MNNHVFEDRQRMYAPECEDLRRQIDRWINEGGAALVEDENDSAGEDGNMLSGRGSRSQVAVASASATSDEPVVLEIRSYRLNPVRSFPWFARERVNAALRRFHGRIRHVTLYVTDVNGLRGGIDKRVRLIVRLRPRGTVIVTATDVNVFVAMAQAASRAGHSVKRKLRRRRTSRVSRAKRRATVSANGFL